MIADLIPAIDAEIDKLQRARALLVGMNGPTAAASTTGKRLGRPPGQQSAPKKGTMTPEGRRRLSEAMKRRWANNKKAAAKVAAAK